MALSVNNYKNSQEMVKVFVFDSKQGQSEQLVDPFESIYQTEGILLPPTDPYVWSKLVDYNTRLGKIIRTTARNTVGMGWEMKQVSSIPDGRDKELAAQKTFAHALFDKPNPEMPFTDLMELMKIDEEATGNGYLEVVRNLKGKIVSLYHAPAPSIRIAKTRDKYVQIKQSNPNDRVYFKCFGDDRQLNKKTGEFNSGSFADGATELIHFKVYSPSSADYGVPRWVATAPAITGNRLQGEWNVNFLRNNAHVPYAIIVNNGRLAAESIKQIQTFINRKGKGIDNTGRVMVLQGETRKIRNKEITTKIELKPLSMGVQDDASFLKYRAANDEEIREAFGFAQICLGTTKDLNRAAALASWQTTVKQEWVPDIHSKEYRIKHTILADMGLDLVELKFNEPRATDPIQEATVLSKLQPDTFMTPNEKRKLITDLLGYELPYINEDWANEPFYVRGRGIGQPEDGSTAGKKPGDSNQSGTKHLRSVSTSSELP